MRQEDVVRSILIFLLPFPNCPWENLHQLKVEWNFQFANTWGCVSAEVWERQWMETLHLALSSCLSSDINVFLYWNDHLVGGMYKEFAFGGPVMEKELQEFSSLWSQSKQPQLKLEIKCSSLQGLTVCSYVGWSALNAFSLTDLMCMTCNISMYVHVINLVVCINWLGLLPHITTN